MRRSSSSSSSNDKKSKRSRSEDHHPRSRSEEVRDKRRQAWLIQQEREREHERLKQKMILEYELKRAAILRSGDHSGRSSHRSRSKSRSRIKGQRSNDENRHSSKPAIMSHKLESTTGNIPLFKGPSGDKPSSSELRRIKVDIHRNIPGTSVTDSELQRDIVNPEEVTLKRREDEAMTSIFDREELKLVESSSILEEVEEHRVLNSLKNGNQDSRACDTLPYEQFSSYRFFPQFLIFQKEITVHRRPSSSSLHEGIKPIFDRDELKLPDCSSTTKEVEEHRIVKVIDIEGTGRKIHLSKRRSRSLSPSGRYNKSSQEASLSSSLRYERSVHYLDRTNIRRSYSSERDKVDRRSRNRENGRKDRLDDRSRHSSSHRPDRKDYLVKRRSSRERSYSEDRKRRGSEYDHSSRLDRNDLLHREHHGRSRERRERKRSLENRDRERSRERRMSTLPHYIEPVPVPVYYGNFPPRPVMMGPIMPIRGSMMRSRLPVGPRVPFLPRFMHPDMYRSAMPRFNRMF